MMTDTPRAREEDPDPAVGVGSGGLPQHGPVVVSQGLAYRDLQRGIFLAFALFIVWQMAGPLTTLLLLFLLVFILAAVLNPIVVRLQERGVPRVLSAVGLVFGILGFLAALGWLVVPPLVDEVGTLFTNFPQKLSSVTASYEDLIARYPGLRDQLPSPEEVVANLQPALTRLLGQVGRYTVNVAVGIFSLVLLMVLVIFTVAHPGPLVTGLLSAAPDRYRPRVESALRRILEQLKNWAFGSLILGLIVGLMTGVGLWLIGRFTGNGVPYILLFSVIAGVGEMIPNLGPVLSAVPPILIALTIDPWLALWVALLFVVIQQLENNLIVPMVMGQSLNLHPLSLTFTVLVMGALFGLLGAILAVPVCAITKVCWEEFYLIPRRTDVEALQDTADDIVNRYASTAAGAPEDEQPGESRLTDDPSKSDDGEVKRLGRRPEESGIRGDQEANGPP